jgi:hypothetical protein
MGRRKTNLTFAVFQRSELSPMDRAKAVTEFDAWEQQHCDAAGTSEQRLAIWDETQNASRLATMSDERESRSATPDRLSARAARS